MKITINKKDLQKIISDVMVSQFMTSLKHPEVFELARENEETLDYVVQLSIEASVEMAESWIKNHPDKITLSGVQA